MAAAKYPLEAARSLRVHEEDACKRSLADAMRAQESAAAAIVRAEDAVRAHAAETARVVADELERDGRGRKVDEALRAQSFLARRRTEEAALRKGAQSAKAAEREAARAVEEARAALAEARAAREAMEKHRAEWEEERKKEREKKEEEEAEERRR